MKFVCESCSARYRIDDGRVQGKVLKIRCKKCGHIIEVRSQEATPSSALATEWHVSVNGVPRGPLTEDSLMESFRSGAIGDEAYVWNASFDAWKAALEIPAFSGALQAAKQAGLRAQHPTTQRLDAGELDKAMAGQASDDVAARVSKKLQALRAEVESGSAPAAEATEGAAAKTASAADTALASKDGAAPAPAGASSRAGESDKTEEIAVNTTSDPEPTSEESDAGDAAAAAVSATSEEVSLELEEAAEAKPPARPSGPAASVASKPAPASDAASAQGSSAPAASDSPSEAAPLDGNADAATPPVPEEAATPASSEEAATPASSEEAATPGVPEEPATPVLPFAATPIGGQVSVGSASPGEEETRPVPVSPEASGSVGAASASNSARNRVTTAQPAALPTAAVQANQDPSASLLFQVRQAKAARNRAIAIAVVALLCMIGFMFAWSKRPAPEPVVTNEPTVEEPIVRSEATPEAIAALGQSRRVAVVRAAQIVHDALENGELAVTPVVPAEAGEPAVARNGNAGGSRSSGNSRAPRISHVETSNNVRTERSRDGRNVTRVASLDSLGSPSDAERAAVGSASLEVGSEGFYGAVGQTGSAVSPDLNAPELRDRRPGPSPELFAPGLRSFVSSSVERCTQRQRMETGSIPQSRVVLSITVENTGEVSRVSADRGSRDTPFERCLQSHRGRWDFPPFSGGATTLQRTYLLQ